MGKLIEFDEFATDSLKMLIIVESIKLIDNKIGYGIGI